MGNVYSTIKILIAGDNYMMRERLLKLLAQYNHLEIVKGDYGFEQLSQLMVQVKPDVVITEPGVAGGITALCELATQHPEIAIIAYNAVHDFNQIDCLQQAGVIGFVCENIKAEELMDAIHTVNKGEIYYCNATAIKFTMLRRSFHKKSGAKIKPLFNVMELQVIQLICSQYSNKEIAAETFASIRTIESVRTRLLTKTNSKNICGIVMYAIKNNIVRLGALVFSFLSPEDLAEYIIFS